MKGKDLKKKVIKFRKDCFEKLLKAYKISEKEAPEMVKICSRKGEHYIILCDKFCWKEVLSFTGNKFEYKLIPYQEFFDEETVKATPSE